MPFKLSAELRAKVFSMIVERFGNTDISRSVGVSEVTVCKYRRQYKQLTGDHTRSIYSQRQRINSTRGRWTEEMKQRLYSIPNNQFLDRIITIRRVSPNQLTDLQGGIDNGGVE